MRSLTLSGLLLAALFFSAALPLIVAGAHGLDSPSARLSHPVVGQDSSSWLRLVPQEEEFSVLLPVQPALLAFQVESYLRPNGQKIEEQRLYSAYANRVVYVVRSYRTSNPRGLLADYLRTHGSSQTFERDLSLDGFNGRQYRHNTGVSFSTIRYFLTHRRLYVVEAVARVENNPAAGRFLSSFRLGEGRNAAVAASPSPRHESDSPAAAPPAEAATAASGAAVAVGQQQSQERIYRVTEVSHRAVIVARPAPPYTDAARAGGITGTVVLRVVLSATGQVIHIVPVQRLEHGLTENAITAARHIKFLPAEIDERPVSSYAQIVYNFDMN